MRAGSQNILCDISGRGEAQNLKIAARFSTKLAQFFDTVSVRKFATGSWENLPYHMPIT